MAVLNPHDDSGKTCDLALPCQPWVLPFKDIITVDDKEIVMDFGKYKGVPLTEIDDDDYLIGIVANRPAQCSDAMYEAIVELRQERLLFAAELRRERPGLEKRLGKVHIPIVERYADELELHDLAKIMPPMTDEEYHELRMDLLENGQREPIWLLDGKVLDGRHRWKVFCEFKKKIACREWRGLGSPIALVVSLNMRRRHLTAGQKAAIAVELLPLLQAEARERQRQAGGDKTAKKGDKTGEKSASPKNRGSAPPPRLNEAADQAAKMTGTNADYVRDAVKIKKQCPSTFEKMKEGKITITAAKADITRERNEHGGAAAKKPERPTWQQVMKRNWLDAGEQDRKDFVAWLREHHAEYL